MGHLSHSTALDLQQSSSMVSCHDTELTSPELFSVFSALAAGLRKVCILFCIVVRSWSTWLEWRRLNWKLKLPSLVCGRHSFTVSPDWSLVGSGTVLTCLFQACGTSTVHRALFCRLMHLVTTVGSLCFDAYFTKDCSFFLLSL